MSRSILKQAQKIYEKYGPSAVYKFALKNKKVEDYCICYECEAVTPNFKNECLLCGTEKPKYYEDDIIVLLHNINFHYELESLFKHPKSELVNLDYQDFITALRTEARERIYEMIEDDCSNGELNCIFLGKFEVRGWWRIN